MEKLKIGIINSTVRDVRVGMKITNWVLEQAKSNSENEYEVLDLKEYPMSFNLHGQKDENAAKFIEKMKSFDAYIFVLAEYNHSIPGVLKNAFDWLGLDAAANKPAAIVSYGAIGGARAAEHLRTILSGLGIAHIYRQVMLNVFTDFDQDKNFNPAHFQIAAFKDLIIQLELWGKAFKTIR